MKHRRTVADMDPAILADPRWNALVNEQIIEISSLTSHHAAARVRLALTIRKERSTP